MSYDKSFMDVARDVSELSLDPSTKVGCVIVDKHDIIVATGHNGFPHTMSSDPSLYADREQKLLRVVHAEERALLTARDSPSGGTAYVWPLPPCRHCILLLAEAGVKTVYSPPPTSEQNARWNFDVTRQLAAEAGVTLVEITDDQHLS